MARDAIARQYDVDKNKVILTCEEGKGGYRPGTITFQAKPGKSIDLDQVRESIAATRLSGKTNMGMDDLEITVTGTVEKQGKEWVLKVAGTNQVFGLSESPTNALSKIEAAVGKGERVTTVIGRVAGWSGRFPVVLENLAKTPPDTRAMMSVVDFEVAKK